MTPRAAIICQADKFDLLRCRCPECLRLDAEFPRESFQLALFLYRITIAPRRA